MSKAPPSSAPGATPLELVYQSQNPFRTLWRWAACPPGRALWMLVTFFIKQSPAWVIPLVTAAVIDSLHNPAKVPPSHMWLWVGLLLVLFAGNIPFHTYYIAQLSGLTRQLERRLRQALVTRLQQLSIPYHDQTESGRLQAKVLRDVEQVQGVASQLGEFGVMTITTLFSTLAITLIREPRILLLYIVLIPMVQGLVQLFRRRIREENRDFRRHLEAMNSEVNQMIEMIPVSRAHGVEGQATDRVVNQFDQVRQTGRRLDKLNALFQSSTWVTFQTSNLMMLVIGALLCRRGVISVGEVVLYQALFNHILMNVNTLLHLYPQIARGFESVRSIGEVLECPDLEQNQGKAPVSSVGGRICFENVGYSYGQDMPAALSEVSLDIAPGECVAVVGPSGGGKSTLLRLTIGFRRPTVGRILLDGRDMEEIDMRTWRRFISVVPQESILFEGSIRDNILFGLGEIDEPRFQEILDAANVREFVERLPQGLNTRIGESGARLSGGQRQRLAIARALVRDPRVIVLDEPTSALDVMSEKLVQDAVERLVSGRTTLIVAHRLSTVRHADRVVVMEGGRIVEMGTYQELSERPDGAFRRMRDLQA